MPVVRVAAYVDGFNLYFGLKAKHGRRYLWLDLQALAESLLRPGQTLERVTYFTARVRKDPEGERRQSEYLHALAHHSPLVTVVAGRFQEKHRLCRQCGSIWTLHEEKETDVNIAVTLVEDAVLDRYDTALLISADSDLRPAIGPSGVSDRRRGSSRPFLRNGSPVISGELSMAIWSLVTTRSAGHSYRTWWSRGRGYRCAGPSTGPEKWRGGASCRQVEVEPA
jgi:uncharacterized LabA/DUF88 family protein